MADGQPHKRLRLQRSSGHWTLREPRKQALVTRTWPDFDPPLFLHNFRVEEKMIKDNSLTEACKAAISQFRDDIAGKVVLDVGCGIGLLAISCAYAGASRVYAVEASQIANKAVDIVKANNLSDMVIVLHGQVESMLPSIIFARNKWLKPGGIILPSNAKLVMAPVTHSDRYHQSINFWKKVYGINMSPLSPLAKRCEFDEPCIETISRSNILGWPILVKEVDCYTIEVEELEFVNQQFAFMSAFKASLHGFAFWFTVAFTRPGCPIVIGKVLNPQSISDEPTILLATGPLDPPTHWEQTLVYLCDPIELEGGEITKGIVTLTQRKANPPRSFGIRISGRAGEQQTFVKETVLRGLT